MLVWPTAGPGFPVLQGYSWGNRGIGGNFLSGSGRKRLPPVVTGGPGTVPAPVTGANYPVYRQFMPLGRFSIPSPAVQPYLDSGRMSNSFYSGTFRVSNCLLFFPGKTFPAGRASCIVFVLGPAMPGLTYSYLSVVPQAPYRGRTFPGLPLESLVRIARRVFRLGIRAPVFRDVGVPAAVPGRWPVAIDEPWCRALP